ncbi:MAG: ferritin family protein [Deltaproteobacteria bacterium]|nr:ferritin family protein [Deltaproteobacteria bacterium]
MMFQDITEILDFAIDREIEAAEFYESASKEEYMSGKKDMLLEFAAEERKHQKLLEDFKAGKTGVNLDDYEFKWITDLKRSDYLVEIEYSPGMPYNELLILAMKREEKSLALYNQLLENSDSENSRKLFKMLCQEEAKHKLALEAMYDDYMAEMGD